jgi:hypothetical protein
MSGAGRHIRLPKGHSSPRTSRTAPFVLPWGDPPLHVDYGEASKKQQMQYNVPSPNQLKDHNRLQIIDSNLVHACVHIQVLFGRVGIQTIAKFCRERA